MEFRRVTAFLGHQGSGKTHLAVNLALRLRESAGAVALADLDIVNPYYRSGRARQILSRRGVTLIASEYEGSNAELPSLPPDIARVFDDLALRAVLDVGGDDRGALALGRYAAAMSDTAVADALFVVNFARPLTPDADAALRFLREIELASHVAVTGIVNNTNLGTETTADTVLRSREAALRLCERANLPLKFTSARADLLPKLQGIGEIFPLAEMLNFAN
jgi:energy-coupling factor transporter ATP-binding protein EcfA2